MLESIALVRVIKGKSKENVQGCHYNLEQLSDCIEAGSDTPASTCSTCFEALCASKLGEFGGMFG